MLQEQKNLLEKAICQQSRRGHVVHWPLNREEVGRFVRGSSSGSGTVLGKYFVCDRRMLSGPWVADNSTVLCQDCLATDWLWCLIFRWILPWRLRWEDHFPMCSKDSVLYMCAFYWMKGIQSWAQLLGADPALSSSLGPVGSLALAILRFTWRMWYLICDWSAQISKREH